MKTLKILVDSYDVWSPYFPSDTLILTKDYLSHKKGNRSYVINLSQDMGYLGKGYYASLLAEANGDRAIPSVKTLNNLQHLNDLSFSLFNIILNKSSIEFLDTVAKSNKAQIKSYFGISECGCFNKLTRRIFDIYDVPILNIFFEKSHNLWKLVALEICQLQKLNYLEETFFANQLSIFSKKVWRKPRLRKRYRYQLAILIDQEEKTPPSNKKSLQKFIKSGNNLGVNVELISQNDYLRLPEYDSLFIRTTTSINHYSYAFAKKAEENDMVVIDSTQAIMRCTNKVYLHHLMSQHQLSTPMSVFIFRDQCSVSYEDLIDKLGLPIVLKVPDGAFSTGVKKASTQLELEILLCDMLKKSAVIIAQKYHYTDYDWRIGILNNKPLYACKYYMVENHWQIVNYHNKIVDHGGAEAFDVNQVPKDVIQLATKSCKLIGKDLYGVDIKLIDEKPYLIEINDNPSLDSPCEDAYLGDDLYNQIMLEFINRMEYKRINYDN
ncbi:RimK family protein [Thiotrichales bacterium 19S11-10]|nr:RimK family protein [Thiotrichales bacterium 19S11-10]